MKKILLFLTMSFNLCVLFGQDLWVGAIGYDYGPDVYTCKGGAIEALVARRELNSTELSSVYGAFFSSGGQFYYLGLKTSDIVAAPSAYYNCHAYAWHLTEGNTNQVWINAGTGDSNLSTYWSCNYGCFVQCSESDAMKIHYYLGNHSAVKSSVAGKYESKFGECYVLRHDPTQVPYTGATYRNYYCIPYIKGSNNVYFSGEEYALYPVPCGTINWSLSSSGSFSVSSATGNSTKILKNSTTSYGTVTLTATVNGTTYNKAITVNSVELWGPSTLNWGTGSSYFISLISGTLIPPVPDATYSWSSGGLLSVTGSGSSVSVNAPSGSGNDSDKVFCTVTLNGITAGNSFQKTVTIK